MKDLFVVIETKKDQEYGQVIAQSTDEDKMRDLARSRMGSAFGKRGDTFSNNEKTVDVAGKDDLKNTY